VGDESANVDDAHRSRVVLVARIALSAAMLVMLIAQVPDFRWQDVFPNAELGTALWLLGAAVLTLLALGLATLRWQTVLHALGLEHRYSTLLSHYLAGQFVSNVLPTTIGGDVLRVSRAARDNGDSPGTFASVVIERLTGWLVLPAITFAGLAINPGLRELGRASLVATLIASVTLVGLVLILAAVDHERLGGRFADREGWQRFAGAVHLGLGRLRSKPSSAASVLGVGFAYQLTLVVAAFMAARAMGIDQARITTLMTFLPAVLILQVLPISISGFGVREGALILFFSHSPLDVPQEQAIGLGLLLYVLNVAVSALGAPALAIGGGGRRKGRTTPVA
jgi:uncharacterized protein (TIRG00374 family)